MGEDTDSGEPDPCPTCGGRGCPVCKGTGEASERVGVWGDGDGDGDGGGGRCFVATAAFGTPHAEELDLLRTFRDEVLLQSVAGRQFVRLYYATSPPVAAWIARREWRRTLVRECLVVPAVRAVALLRGEQ